MKKTIMLLIMLSVANVSYAFTDIENHWAKEYINWGITEQIINGYNDGTFRPNDEITINEFLKMLVEASKYKKEIIGKRWPDWYIATAKKYEWIEESQFDDFERKITRNEVVDIISNYIKLDTINKTKTKIKDLSENNKSNVLKLITLNVINGYEDNTFRGEKTITRAEAIKIIKHAANARQKVIVETEYALSSEITNIGREKENSLYRNRYEVRNNKLYFYDNGRYTKLDGYRLKNTYIKEEKIINLLKNIVSEDTYTSVNYVPDENTINQLIIAHGDREGYLYNGSERFSITFYENKLYDVKNITKEEEFSEKCFMKIKTVNLWLWREEIEKGSYINEYKIKTLEKAIRTILGNNVTNELMPYIKQKIIDGQLREADQKIVESINIGKYKIDTYAYEGARVEFYVSEK